MTNYGGIDAGYTGYQQAKVVIIPVPFDATSTWGRGAGLGPDAILEASANMELFDIQTQSEVYKRGIHTHQPVGITESPEEMVNQVRETVFLSLTDQKFPVVIGGNHSVSIGPILAASQIHHDLTVIQLDAHTDLRQHYEGSPLNHACVMARAREVAKVVHLGIRSMCAEELDFFTPSNIFYAHEMVGRNDWYDRALEGITGPVYLTIDLDVFDPSVLPSTGTPEPGGLYYYDVYNFISHLISRHRLIAFDVVELAPVDREPSSDFLASKLIYQILSLIFKS